MRAPGPPPPGAVPLGGNAIGRPPGEPSFAAVAFAVAREARGAAATRLRP
jgi:hypothetical protein